MATTPDLLRAAGARYAPDGVVGGGAVTALAEASSFIGPHLQAFFAEHLLAHKRASPQAIACSAARPASVKNGRGHRVWGDLKRCCGRRRLQVGLQRRLDLPDMLRYKHEITSSF